MFWLANEHLHGDFALLAVAAQVRIMPKLREKVNYPGNYELQ